MPNVGTLDFTARIDYRKAEAQARRFQQQIDRGFGRNNGFSRLAGDARDFERTLGSATNRVVAFGAAAVVFNTLSNSVRAFVNSLVEVDKNLADINVNLNQSAQGLKQFGAQLFNVARETGQTFETAAKAAAELARQGLSAEETIKRLKDALILSRISGLDSASAVETLTAAINSFNQEALTSAEVVNKFAAVDTKFAVSSRDIAEAVSRVGSTAQAAGVGINELIALVTSLQQTTARGGATIGNGLKTIFTRIQAAPETVAALQSVGVAIKDTSGALRSGIDILRDYAKAREKLGEAERSSLDRTVAGTFQINVLKAAIGDLSKEYSIYDSALRTSVNATDEAIRKNEQLNQTLSSLINATSVSIKQLVASIGEADLAPALRGLFSFIENARKFLSGESGSQLGETFGDGLIKGIANVISGPAFLGIGALLALGLKKIFSTLKQEASTLFSINNAATARARVQERINILLKNATSAETQQLQAARSVTAQKEALLAIQTRLNRELLVGTELQNAFLTPGRFGVGSAVSPQLKKGYIGNFADPLASAIAREKAAGVPASSIYIDKDPRVASSGNPGGLLVANTRDEPLGGYQGVNRVISGGGNPKTAGSVPNFALTGRDLPFVPKKAIKELNQILEVAQSQTRLSGFYTELSKATDIALAGSLGKKGSESLFKEIGRVTDERLRLEKQIEIGRLKGAKRAKEFAEQDKRLADLRERLQANAANVEKRRLQRQSGLSAYPSPIGPAFSYGSPIGPVLPPNYLQRQAGLKGYPSPIGPTNPLANMRIIGLPGGTGAPGLPASAFPMTEAQQARYNQVNAPIAPQSRLRLTREQRASLREAGRLDRAQALERRRNLALGAGLALPFAAGFIPEGTGGTTRGIVGGAAQGALQGSTLGIFGPVAGIVGAAGGGIIGALTKLQKSTAELAAEFEETAAKRNQENDALDRAIALQEQLNIAREEGAAPNVIKKIENELSQARSGIFDQRRRDILGVSDASEQQRRRDELRAESAREDALGQIRVLLKDGVSGNQDKLAQQIALALKDGDINLSDDSLAKIAGTDFARSSSFVSLGVGSAPSKQFLEEQRKAAESFSEGSKKLEPLLSKIGVSRSDLNQENLQGVALALYRALGLRAQSNANAGPSGSSGLSPLPSSAFTSPANNDVFRNAALTGRNPLAGQTGRGKADFALFSELISTGAVSADVLASNPRYRQSKALTQGSNAADALISYISGLGGGYNISALKGPRGEPRFDAIQRILEQSSRSGSLNAGRSADLLPLVNQIKDTYTQGGVKRQPLYTEGVTGLTPGADYGAFFKQAQETTNKLVEAAGNVVVKTALSVDGTIKVMSDLMTPDQLEALAQKLTATVGQQYEAQITTLNARLSKLEGKPVPPGFKTLTPQEPVMSKAAAAVLRPGN